MLHTTNVFYLYTELFLSLIGAFLLMAIWKNVRSVFRFKLQEDESIKRVDKGLMYLSLAFLVWVLKDITFLFVSHFGDIMAQGINVVFSLINSLFFILALFFFEYAPSFISYNKKNVIRLFGGFFIVSIFSFVLYVLFDIEGQRGFNYSSFPDLIISSILSYLLLVSFYKTFKIRHLPSLAYMSVMFIGVMFFSQVLDILPLSRDYNQIKDLIKIVAKSSLISLCLVLAVSWVIELAQTPKSSEMSLVFKDWSHLSLNIPSKGIVHQKIDFGSRTKQFRNLLKFAIRRKYAPVNAHCIEIIRGGEIQGQTYLTRIIDELNKVEIQEPLERKDIFTFIGLGKYRIRFLPKNIQIDPALLHEFCNEKDMDIYKGFIES